MMDSKKYTKVFVLAFMFLYLLVAAISFCHAIEFFTIGNVQWMAIMLAFAFELGLAVCLASILLGRNRNNTVAWILLVVLVIVQVCGNTYSVFKYISMSNTDYYQYLAKPLLFFIEEVSQESVQIIISWIMGAILPIVAMLMTEMISKQLKDLDDESKVSGNVVDFEEAAEISSEQEVADEPSKLHEESSEKQNESGIVQTIKKVLSPKKEQENEHQKIKFTQTGPMIQKPKPDIEHYIDKKDSK